MDTSAPNLDWADTSVCALHECKHVWILQKGINPNNLKVGLKKNVHRRDRILQ